jgi:DNA-directed RNA polymerase beta' subunit
MIKSQVAFDFLSIQLASPHQIKRWGTYTRTNGFRFGQILTNKLIITDTLKPAPFGLFCEKNIWSYSEW